MPTGPSLELQVLLGQWGGVRDGILHHWAWPGQTDRTATDTVEERKVFCLSYPVL